MATTRRQLLAGAGMTAFGAVLMGGLAGCGDGGGAGASGELRFTWWGNDVRNKLTDEAINTYVAAHEGVTITPEPGEWSSYWEKLATQVAAGDEPDIIQMDEKYIREYGDRGALLDLAEAGVDTSKFAEGTAEPGIIQDKLIGINAGSNTPVLVANPAVFSKLKVELPDDTTWTWEEFRDLAAEMTGKGGVTGTSMVFNNDAILSAWLRQNDKNLFNDDGLAFEAADAAEYFELMMTFLTEKAMPGASAVAEDIDKPLAQTLFGTSKTAMAMCWSNQVKAFDSATGEDLKILRLPSLAGRATERKAWYKASMFFSAAARSKDPEGTGAFIDWLVNSVEAGDILLTERGLTPNVDVLAAIEDKLEPSDKKVATFMDAIKPELADPPPPPVVGGGVIQDELARACTNVLFKESSPQDAGQAFVDAMNNNIQR